MSARDEWLNDPDFQRLAARNARRMGISRRDFIGLVVAAGGMAVAAACGGSNSKNNGNTAASNSNAANNAAGSANKAANTGGVALSTPAVASTPAAQPVQGGALTVALATEPTSGGLDANVTPLAVTHRVIENIYDTLIPETNDFQFKPSLASSWTIAPDGKSYTFKLRNDVKFHDGTAFDANAVKFNFDRIMDKNTASLYAKVLLGPYDSTTVVDPQTVQVNFKTAYAPFLYYASEAFLGFVSPAAVQKFGADYANNPVGTGPFVFKEWAKQDHITLTKNPAYNWGSSLYFHSGPAYLDSLTFKIVPETATRTAALQAGEADLIETVPPSDVDKLKGTKNLFVVNALSPGDPFVLFFNQSKPPFDDIAARQAFFYGVDRDGMIKAFFNNIYPKADAPLAPTTFAYDKAVEGMYPYDPKKAKQILDAAGWKAGSDGILAKNGTRFSVDYHEGDVDREMRHEIAESIQQQMKDLGIEVKVTYLAAAPAQQALVANDYNMTGTSFVSSDPDILNNLYNSQRFYPAGSNFGHLNNPQVDDLLNQGIQETDRAKRTQIYAQVQQAVMQAAIGLPIYVFPYIMAGQNYVQGLKFDVRAYPIFYDAFVKK
jgi:peptide/nickel transport system substrate-binding protein